MSGVGELNIALVHDWLTSMGGGEKVVIGGGTELAKLSAMAKPNVKVLGRQPDDVVREHYQKCRAFIFPGEEDFGM